MSGLRNLVAGVPECREASCRTFLACFDGMFRHRGRSESVVISMIYYDQQSVSFLGNRGGEMQVG